MDYGDNVWGERCNKALIDKLQVLQHKTAKVIIDRPLFSFASEALEDLFNRRTFNRNLFVFKSFNNLIEYNFNVLGGKDVNKHNTKYAHILRKPIFKTNCGKQRSSVLFIDEWNTLPDDIKNLGGLTVFNLV